MREGVAEWAENMLVVVAGARGFVYEMKGTEWEVDMDSGS